MSNSIRKVGHYAIWLEKEGKKYFCAEEFIEYLEKILQVSGDERILRNNSTAIAIDIEKYRMSHKKNIEIVFKSCKYNHSPNYMSSKDGVERETQKKLFEGEKEITHMLIQADGIEKLQKDTLVIFEERRAGVSFANAIKYINTNLEKLQKDQAKKVCIKYAYIPSIDFIESLSNSKRVTGAEIFVERKILGSDYLNLLDADESVNEEVVISVKAKRKRDIGTLIKNKFLNIQTTKNREIKRIRLHCKDDNNNNVVLDTLAGRKTESVEVELVESGIVESASLFNKMEEILEVKDEK